MLDSWMSFVIAAEYLFGFFDSVRDSSGYAPPVVFLEDTYLSG